MLITPKQVRAGNEFNWEPIIEVAKLDYHTILELAVQQPVLTNILFRQFLSMID
ncbi:hypothetical protein GASC598B02_001230, partial [Gilliamella apicola SCGC AB-598-B02]